MTPRLPALGIIGVILALAACGKVYDKQPVAAAGGAAPPVVAPSDTTKVTEDAARRTDTRTGSAGCSIDTLNGMTAVNRMSADLTKPVTFVGWAIDKAGGEPPSAVAIVLESDTASYSAPAKIGLPRRDVAEALQDPRLGNSGYRLAADVSALPEGTYRLAIFITDSGGVKRCNLPRSLTLAKH